MIFLQSSTYAATAACCSAFPSARSKLASAYCWPWVLQTGEVALNTFMCVTIIIILTSHPWRALKGEEQYKTTTWHKFISNHKQLCVAPKTLPLTYLCTLSRWHLLLLLLWGHVMDGAMPVQDVHGVQEVDSPLLLVLLRRVIMVIYAAD